MQALLPHFFWFSFKSFVCSCCPQRVTLNSACSCSHVKNKQTNKPNSPAVYLYIWFFRDLTLPIKIEKEKKIVKTSTFLLLYIVDLSSSTNPHLLIYLFWQIYIPPKSYQKKIHDAEHDSKSSSQQKKKSRKFPRRYKENHCLNKATATGSNFSSTILRSYKRPHKQKWPI